MVNHKENPQSTIVKKCLTYIFNLKKAISVKNPFCDKDETEDEANQNLKHMLSKYTDFLPQREGRDAL